MKTETSNSHPAPHPAPESSDPSKLYGRHFPDAARSLVLAQARQLGAKASGDRLVGTNFRVLCTLESIGERMIGQAEEAIVGGTPRAEAYQPWHGFQDAVLLLAPAEKSARQPRPARKPATSVTPRPAPPAPARPESATTLGDTLSPEVMTALTAAVAPPRPPLDAAPAAPNGKKGRAGKDSAGAISA